MFNRFRQKDNLASGTFKQTIGTVTSIGSSGYRIIGTSKVIYDNGPWGKFVPGQYRNNPVDVRQFVGESVPCNWILAPSAYSSYKQVTISGDYPAIYATPIKDIQNSANINVSLGNLALIRAYGDIESPDLDVGMFLAEISSTVNMLAAPLKPLVKLMNEMYAEALGRPLKRTSNAAHKKSSRKSKGRLEDTLANLWLSYRYGAVPLIMDIQTLMGLLKNPQTHKRGVLERRKAGRGGSTTVTTVKVEKIGLVNAKWNEDVTSTTRINAGVYFVNTFDWTSKFGGDVFDVPSLVYNLVPLSFVLDWAYNFGDFLQAARPRMNTSPLGTYTSYMDEVHFHRTPIEVFLNGTPEISATKFNLLAAGSYRGITSKYVRLVGPPVPINTVGIKPGIFDIQRSLDSVSLLWQFRPKFMR